MKVYEITSENSNLTENPLVPIGTGLGKIGQWAAGKLGSAGKKARIRKSKQTARDKEIKKAAAASKEAKYAASGLVAGLNPNVLAVIKSVGATGVILEYYTEVKFFEAEYAKYPTSGIYRPNEGKNNTKEEAYARFREDCDKALGALELSLAAIIAPVKLARLIKSSLSVVLGFAGVLAGLAGTGGAVVAGASLTVGLIPLLAKGSIMLSKKAGMSVAQLEAAGLVGLGAALTWIHTTDAGKAFITQGLLAAITQGLGFVTRNLLGAAADWAKQYKGPGSTVANAIGNTVGSTTAAGGGPQAPAPDPAAAAELAANAKLSRFLQVTTRGKTKYLNNFRITDANGYLLPGLDSIIADTADRAKEAGVPSPFDSIPKDPKVNYSINVAL